MFLKRPFQIGSLVLPSNVFCAPLAGCSDLPFRRTLLAYQPGLIFCEMVKMDAMLYKNPRTTALLEYEPTMHPIGAQICGSDPKKAATCAKMIEGMGFDLIDLNCGCPVDKVTKDGSGSAMLKNPKLIGEVVAAMVDAVKIPVTVKVRAGWDENQIVAPEITRLAEEAGAVAITIHGRTRSQNYEGTANTSYIRDCKSVAKKILVIGNGGIFDAPSAERMFTETGCDAILLSRGLMGQPWLIEDIYRHLSGEPPLIRDGKLARDTFLDHLNHIASWREDEKAVFDLRRVGCWFLRGKRGMKELREWINHAESVEEIREKVISYPWEREDD